MKRKVLSMALVLTFSLTTFAPVTAMAAEEEQILEETIETEETKLNVSRISADSRFNTAIEASKNLFPNGSKAAVIVNGRIFADGLAGGTLATRLEAPLLLIDKFEMSTELKTELIRLGVEDIYILGGEATISDHVIEKIRDLDIRVERIAGGNRVETARKVSTRIKQLKKMELKTNIGVDGRNFPDALSAAPFIGQVNEGYMSLYAGKRYEGQKTYFNIVVGGISSIPKEDETERYSGSSRYATAVEVAKAYKTKLNKDIDTIVLVDGTNYPDALSSSPVASMNNGAILLTRPTNLPKETKDFIKENKNIKNIIIVGGKGSVSTEVENELKELVR